MDDLNQMADLKEVEAIAYRCPECGEALKYNAATRSFTCDYCKGNFSEAEVQAVAQHTEQQQSTKPTEGTDHTSFEFEAGTNVYSCSNCGAEIMADDKTAATFCFYCHSPVILNGRVSGKYRPDSILPFMVDESSARNIFKKWCSKKWFLPPDFTYSKQEGNLVGLYVPFWVTDCQMNGSMEALGKQSHSWTQGSYRYTETKEFAVAREADIMVRGVPADGASHIDDTLMEACEPFDYNQARPFAMQYMSGFQAERYDVDQQGVFPRIEKRAKQAVESLLRSSMKGYSSVSVTHSSIEMQSVKWRYMLLPVWFLSYKYKDKVYEFAINGQSGKFVGCPPISWKKVTLATIGAWLLTALIVVILGVLAN